MQTSAAEALDAAEANFQLNHREYAQQKVELESFPYHIQIGADNRCNLKCGFCMAAADREKGMLHIQDRRMEHNAIEIFRRLKPFMRYWKYLSVTGPGESLLNPRLPEILGMIRAESDCVIVITTNGVTIDEGLADSFIENRIHEIAISLDSLTKEVYEELRLNAKFEDVMAAIDRLNSAKSRRGSQLPRISATPNFMTLNIRELPSFIDFAVAKGIYKIQATPTQIYRRSWVDRSLLYHPDLTRKMAEEADRRARQSGIEFSNGLEMVYLNRNEGLMGKLLGRKPEKRFPDDPSECLKPWMSLYIEPDGEVRPCCYQSPIYGNIFESDLEKLWNGTEARQLRKQMIEDDLPQACRECYEFNRHDPSIMVQV